MHTGFWWENLKKKPLGRHGHRQEDNIRMHLKELGWDIIWLESRGLG